MKEILTQSASGTKKEGVKLACLLMNKKPEKNARIIALEGRLGSGKTTFIQGLAEGLGVRENVLSPTFLILKQFPLETVPILPSTPSKLQNRVPTESRILDKIGRSSISKPNPKDLGEIGRKYKSLYHIDAYRLKNPKEIVEFGFEDLVRDPENIIVIEWADKIRKILPKNAIWIKFEDMGGEKRKMLIKN